MGDLFPQTGHAENEACDLDFVSDLLAKVACDPDQRFTSTGTENAFTSAGASDQTRADSVSAFECGLDTPVHRVMEKVRDETTEEAMTRSDARSHRHCYETGLDALLCWCAFLLPSAVAVEHLRKHALERYTSLRTSAPNH